MVTSEEVPIPEDIGEWLRYDSMTGELFWVQSPARNTEVGAKAGNLQKDGYVRVEHRGIKYYVHRIAWFLHYGEQPPPLLDHRNRKRWDNRIVNLRIADKSLNALNSDRFGSL